MTSPTTVALEPDVAATSSNMLLLAGVLAIAVAPLALLAAINPSFSAATFTGVLVLLVPGIVHVGPIESAFFRVLEVAVGGVTAVAVSFLVLPARAHSLAIEAAAQMLDLAAQSLSELFAGFVQARDATAIGRIQDGIGQAFARLEAIAAEARHERMRSRTGWSGWRFFPTRCSSNTPPALRPGSNRSI